MTNQIDIDTVLHNNEAGTDLTPSYKKDATKPFFYVYSASEANNMFLGDNFSMADKRALYPNAPFVARKCFLRYNVVDEETQKISNIYTFSSTHDVQTATGEGDILIGSPFQEDDTKFLDGWYASYAFVVPAMVAFQDDVSKGDIYYAPVSEGSSTHDFFEALVDSPSTSPWTELTEDQEPEWAKATDDAFLARYVQYVSTGVTPQTWSYGIQVQVNIGLYKKMIDAALEECIVTNHNEAEFTSRYMKLHTKRTSAYYNFFSNAHKYSQMILQSEIDPYHFNALREKHDL